MFLRLRSSDFEETEVSADLFRIVFSCSRIVILRVRDFTFCSRLEICENYNVKLLEVMKK